MYYFSLTDVHGMDRVCHLRLGKQHLKGIVGYVYVVSFTLRHLQTTGHDRIFHSMLHG